MNDGTYRYYGEGQTGDMRFARGNKAIYKHVQNNDRLFLFDAESGIEGRVLYNGEFKLHSAGEDRGPDRDGNDRKRIYFNLTPVGSITDTNETGSEDIDSQDLFDEGDQIIVQGVGQRRKLADLDDLQKFLPAFVGLASQGFFNQPLA